MKPDPVGDSHGAPDVTAVTIADKGGVLTITVVAKWVPIVPGCGVDHNRLDVALDTDADAATGFNGVDHILMHQVDARGKLTTGLFKLDSDGYGIRTRSSSRLGFSHSGSRYTFTLSAADIDVGAFGIFKAFVVASSKDAADRVLARDRVPDTAVFTHMVEPATTYPTQTYVDPGGDNDAGPDFTSLTIGQGPMIDLTATAPMTRMRGVLQFKYVVAKLDLAALPGAASASVSTSLDTNHDGEPEYTLVFGVDAGGPYGFLADTRRHVMTPMASNTTGPDGTTHTFMLSPAGLGGATSFEFKVLTGTTGEDGAATPADATSGSWSYDLGVKPLLGPMTVVPARAVAGRIVTVTVPVTRSDTLRKLTTGVGLTVDARIGSNPGRHSEQLSNGIVTIRVALPRTLHDGVTVSVAATLGSHTARRATTIPKA